MVYSGLLSTINHKQVYYAGSRVHTAPSEPCISNSSLFKTNLCHLYILYLIGKWARMWRSMAKGCLPHKFQKLYWLWLVSLIDALLADITVLIYSNTVLLCETGTVTSSICLQATMVKPITNCVLTNSNSNSILRMPLDITVESHNDTPSLAHKSLYT